MRSKILLFLSATCLIAVASSQAAFFTGDTYIGPDNRSYDGQEIVVIGCTVTIDGPHSFSDVLVIEEGTIAHSPITNGTNAGLNLKVSNNLLIEAGSALNADGQGYAPGTGPGAGESATNIGSFDPLYNSGGGGAYGGNGGTSFGDVPGGIANGWVLTPTNAGSGGGAGFGAGSAGGGIINLTVGNVLVVDGQITANGAASLSPAAGGGSGGGISILAAAASGAGIISAKGGGSDGGGGGGGRIALTFINSDFTGVVTAQGGTGFEAGGAGTVAFTSDNNANDQILVDNGGLSGPATPLLLPVNSTLTLSGGASACFSNVTQTLSTLNIASNSWLTTLPEFPALQLTVNQNVNIQAGGGINLTGAAVTTNVGPGVASTNLGIGIGGIYASNGFYYGGGGGGHGGLGGNGDHGVGGRNYGSILEPVELGSAGGQGSGTSTNNEGGAGGGAVKLTVIGTLTLNGSILADGGAGPSEDSGGGSGGSVWIQAENFTGDGLVSANGGNSGSPNGGGGGGGRIVVAGFPVVGQVFNNTFTGIIADHGGTGFVNGGAGTIAMDSFLILDNDGLRGASTPFAVLSPLADLIVSNGAVGLLLDGPWQANSLMIGSNSLLDLPTGLITLEGNMTIQAGGGIVVTGAPAFAPQATTPALGAGGGNAGAGGSSIHGSGGATTGAFSGFSTFGQGESGGNGPSNTGGGAGGGIFTLEAQHGTLTLNGFINANGQPAVPGSSGGGGAGGSVDIQAQSISGNGAILANGGAGDGTIGGGGGGGSITISGKYTNFTSQLIAHGGTGFVAGGAGTIEESTPLTVVPLQVILDNGGLSGTNTLLTGLPTCVLTVTNGAVATMSVQGPTLQNLSIGSNSFLNIIAPAANLLVTSNLIIAAGGGIKAEGSTYAYGSGPGQGLSFTSNNITTGGGGGNGGYGGNSAFGARGGNAGGALENTQANYGAYGGNQGGGAGGSLFVNILGNLVVNGAIDANGFPGLTSGSGGGAGGGLSLEARVISGNGLISANGGSGQLPYGGGGGGGLISISAISNQFTGRLTAYGGNGAMPGGAGLILEEPSVNVAPINIGVSQVIIDNGGLSGTNTPLGKVAPGQYDVSILNGAIAVPSQYSPGWRNLLIGSNSFLLTSGNTIVILNLLGNTSIQSGGGIIADAQGYAAGAGPGASKSSGTPAAGAGYGGYGGSSQSGVPGGPTYGIATEPNTLGSGGGVGVSSPSPGGQGGGALELTVAGTLLVQGNISANGARALSMGGGGGSGGSIFLTATVLSGNGSITANGGAGQLPSGGGGGGGRIAIVTITNSFTGVISAYGGPGFMAGGPGTVYTDTRNSNLPAQLIIDGGGRPGAYTTIATFPNFENVIIRGGGVGVFGAGAPSFSMANLFVGSNSFLLQTNPTAVTLTVSSNVTVQAGGGIIFDGVAVGGLGVGQSTLTPYGYLTGSGGGYGGNGGNGASGAAGGISYGMVMEPTALGSSGGFGFGLGTVRAGGGGALILQVEKALTNDGVISANGAPGLNGGGGGSGGSLNLSATTLTGSGLISANGGPGDSPDGGGGGGGRIALRASSTGFTGAVSAQGGVGFAAGGAGTLYLSPFSNTGPEPGLQLISQVIIDNGGISGAKTPLGTTAGLGQAPASDLIITGGANVTPAGGWTVRNLLLESNSVINQLTNSGAMTMEGDALVDRTSLISANGQGWDADTGPGAGSTASNYTSSGGGYGGMGGASEGGAPGGVTNGSAQIPTGWGSGGGVLFGEVPNLSQGGGALALNVAGTFTVNGTVSADGSNATFPGAGGGAGGSVWLTVGSLAGTGAITANGGNGQDNIGGGGGGGRIAIYAPSTDFTGLTLVNGGSGFTAGQSGTIYLSTNLDLPILPPIGPIPLLAVPSSSPNLLTLDFTGVANASYQVQSSTDLLNWQPYGGVISGNGGTTTITVTLAAESQRYFRLVPAN